MSNRISMENNISEQNYFSKDHLLKNFLSISVIYISLISIASYFVYSTIVSYALFLFSLLLFILRILFVRKKLSYNTASIATISLILFCLVPVCAYFSGGIFSPILWWYIIVPIISLLLFGRCVKTAVLSGLAVLFVIIFAVMEMVHFKFPAFDNSRLHVSIFISLLGLLFLSYTITWIFETQKTFAYKKLTAEKERLKISEAGFRDIFDNTDELIQNISYDDAKFVMVNPTWLNTLEYSNEELKNMTFEDIIFSKNKEEYETTILRLKNEKSIDNIQLIFKTKTGNKIYVEGETGVMFKNDMPISIRGIFRNVSLKKIAEDNMHSSRLALEQAQELAQIGSWEINLVNETPTWSKEMYRIFEIESYKTGSILDAAFKNRLSALDNESIKNLILSIFKNAQVASYELKIKNKKGETKYINIIGEPLKNENINKIIGVKGTAQDVTKQKLAVLAKSNFLSTMSHEIRTPINGVIGIANLLKSENLTDLQKEYVDTLHLSSQHLLSIISEILDFSKMESGHFTFKKESLNVFDTCKNIYDEFETKAIKNNLVLNFIPADNHLINVNADKERLTQVLSNLLSNAIKFTENGTIDFLYELKEKEDKVDIKFAIKDTGIGIAESAQATIFDIFSQGDETTTRAFGGTGLGLATSKRLIDLQQGKLYFNSELGKGSTFFVELSLEKLAPNKVLEIAPVVDEPKIETLTTPEELVEETPKPIAKKLDGMRILVAEDNAVNAMVLTRFLTKWGIEYDVAKNGQLAVDKLESTTYDLILMDLQMPVMGGKEATKIIRTATNNYNTIPIIALTANAILDTQTEILNEGFNDCILKPFNPDELYNAIALYHK